MKERKTIHAQSHIYTQTQTNDKPEGVRGNKY